MAGSKGRHTDQQAVGQHSICQLVTTVPRQFHGSMTCQGCETAHASALAAPRADSGLHSVSTHNSTAALYESGASNGNNEATRMSLAYQSDCTIVPTGHGERRRRVHPTGGRRASSRCWCTRYRFCCCIWWAGALPASESQRCRGRHTGPATKNTPPSPPGDCHLLPDAASQ